MAAVGNLMYILVAMKTTPKPPFHQSAVGSPLGNVLLGGVILNGSGTPRDRLRTYNAYALVYTLGTGEYRDAHGVQQLLRPGDFIFVFPELPHHYGPRPGGRWDECYATFRGPVFDLWRKTGLLDPARPVLHREPLAYWRRRLEEIAAPNRPALERVCRLQLLLADLLDATPRASADELWLANARALLAADLGRPLYVEEVARQLALSPETFRKKFTRLAGQSPWRFRLERTIDQAQRLVHEGQATNKQIAAQLGFSDEFHFSRRFKQIAGLSPTQFRALVPRAR